MNCWLLDGPMPATDPSGRAPLPVLVLPALARSAG